MSYQNDNFFVTVFALIGMGIGLVALIVGVSALMALPTMLLWNGLLTDEHSVIGVALPPLTFMRAWGLNFLCGILFKGGSSTPKRSSSSK